MRISRWLVLLPSVLLSGSAPTAAPVFHISFPAARSSQPLDGRLLLILSADSTSEPRFQVSDAASTAQIFGVNVDGWKPATLAAIDSRVFGYPLPSLEVISQLKPGRYRIQALLNRYETFRRSDGHVVKLPPDQGEGQQWARKPG